MAAEQKTKLTEQPVEDFLNNIPDKTVKADCMAIVKLMEDITGYPPKMWGSGIIGFGTYHYRYESGHEGDSCLTGFSPRKNYISIYAMPGSSQHTDLLEQLGKYKAGKECLYIKKLEDVDLNVLKKLIEQSVALLTKRYPAS